MHQRELWIDLGVWEVKVQRASLENPPQGQALREKGASHGARCALFPLLEKALEGRAGQEEGRCRGQTGQLGLCGFGGGGALASQLPAPTPALLSSRFSAEQTRMVSVASPESHAGG